MATKAIEDISSERSPLLGDCSRNPSSGNRNTCAIDEAQEFHFGRASVQEEYRRQKSSSLCETCEVDRPVEDPLIYKSYNKRWYILTLFSLVAVFNNILWTTWGPLVDATSIAWQWDEDTIALLANWGSVSYLVSVVLFVWLLDYKGN